MEVELKLEKWRVEADKETKTPVVKGNYNVLMNGTSIAMQDFNGDYNSKKIPFSGDVIQKIIEVEKLIVGEIQKLLN